MTSTKPTALEVWPRHVPAGLKAVRGWLLWKYEFRDGKWTKPPVNEAGERIDAHNPDNWMDFSTALQAYQKGGFDGIGFSLNAMPGLVGADLDHCVKGGVIEPWALEIIEELGGYAETSPSGSGVRVFGLGRLTRAGRKKGDIEVYDSGRYLTVTGHRLDNSAYDLVDFDAALNGLHLRVWPERPETPHKRSGGASIGDEDLIQRIRASRQAEDFEALFSGGSCGHPSDSEADLSFCNLLAFWTGCDAGRIDRIVRASGRYRPKWDEDRGGQTYGEITIQKAISGRGEVYRPSTNPTDEARDFIETVKEGLKEDPRKLKDRGVLAALLTLREKDPLEFDLLTDELKDAGAVRLSTLKRMVDGEERRQADEKARVEEERGEDGPEVSEEIKKKAKEILESGDPIQARCDYVAGMVEGNVGVAKAFIYSCSSAYMPASDKLHADAVGASQGGKSVTVGAVHSTYPPENLEILTEASPKSVYYLAKRYEEEGRSFDDVIIYINDARTEHIPVLKVFRDDGPGSPRNLTVVDGESLDLVVPGRPIVQSSSVLPLRDDEGQAVSRSFLATVADVDEAGEKKVRGKIRQGLQYGALRRPEADTEKAILQQMGRILRDEGIREVVVPFDSPEPSSADRRGTGQFIRLIKISAHENQFQRPILELKDGRRFVVATYADLQNAAEVWFEFEEAQAFKINHKVLKVFKALPTIEPDHYNFTGSSPSKNRIAKDTGISPKSVERYLSDLYDAELIYRKKASAPGNPYVFWTTDKMRQKVMSQISDTGDDKGDLGQIETKNGCLKYLGKNCPDSLKDSSKAFFNNQDILKKENVKGIYYSSTGGRWSVSGEKIISSLDFLANRVLNAPLEAADSEYLGQSVLSQMPEEPPVVDSKMGRILSRGGGNVSKDEDHHQTIAEELAEDRRRQAEEAERTATPPPKPKGDEGRAPTSEEAEVLADVAGRLLLDWPGLSELKLWETTRDRLGRPISIATVRLWLAAEGYILSSERLNGSPLWNPPVAGVMG